MIDRPGRRTATTRLGQLGAIAVATALCFSIIPAAEASTATNGTRGTSGTGEYEGYPTSGLTDEDITAIEALVSTTDEAASSATTQWSGRVSQPRTGYTTNASTRSSYYNGSVLAWYRNNIDFGYDWSRVTWSSAYQEIGAILPHTMETLGIKKYYDTNWQERYRAQNRHGGGVPSPWGNVNFYSHDFTDAGWINADGSWGWDRKR